MRRLIVLVAMAGCGGREALDGRDAAPEPPDTSAPRVVQVAVGGQHACALISTGTVRCWGDNSLGELGDGTYTSRLTPVDVVGLAGSVTAISTAWDYSCALLSSGAVQCWGTNAYSGQLGDGMTNGSNTPTRVMLGGAAIAISAGEEHACALLSSGAIRCWGANDAGQLGDGTGGIDGVYRRLTPVEVVALGGAATAISAGYGHTCALLSTGTMRCWGSNSSGALGDGTTMSRNTPVDVMSVGGPIAEIAAGNEYTCALLSSGQLRCWGTNYAGQLDDGTTTDRHTPVDVVPFGAPVGLVSAANRACALLTSGSVSCWGWSPATPVAALGGSATLVSIRSSAACALLTSGSVRCWGDNEWGQLGDGTRTSSTVPVTVFGLP